MAKGRIEDALRPGRNEEVIETPAERSTLTKRILERPYL